MKKERNIHFICKQILAKSCLFIINRRQRQKYTMFLSKISIHSCITIFISYILNHIYIYITYVISYIYIKKHLCSFSLQAFSTKEILKCHINGCFKINGKQMIQMSKEGEYIKLKMYERKKITIYDISRF